MKIETAEKSLFFVHGDDEFRVSQQVKRLRNQILHPQTKEASTKTASSDLTASFKEISPKEDLFSEIFGVSLFAKSKFLMLNLSEFDSSELSKVLEAEAIPLDVKLIIYQKGKADKRTKLFKFLSKSADLTLEVNQFSPWKTAEITKWLQEIAQEKEIKIEHKALSRLVDFYGTDTASLSSELERLATYTADEMVTADCVNKLCESQEDLFSVAKDILQNKLAEACNKAKNIINFQSPLPLIAGLQTIFRGYLIIKELDEKGTHSSEIAKALGKNPWKIGQDTNKLKRIKPSFLSNVVLALNQLEQEVKTGENSDPANHFRFRILSLG